MLECEVEYTKMLECEVEYTKMLECIPRPLLSHSSKHSTSGRGDKESTSPGCCENFRRVDKESTSPGRCKNFRRLGWILVSSWSRYFCSACGRRREHAMLLCHQQLHKWWSEMQLVTFPEMLPPKDVKVVSTVLVMHHSWITLV